MTAQRVEKKRLSFNRYMVECEQCTTALLLSGVKTVLIDTWWNVNDGSKENEKIGADGFNRYMVECEYVRKATPGDAWYSFNRYMVECECSSENLCKDF